VIAVYPESNYAAQAKDALREAEQQETRAPLVRSITFRNFRGATADELLKRLAEHEARVQVERPFDSRDLEEAKKILLEFMAGKKGQKDADIHADFREASPDGVSVTFTMRPKVWRWVKFIPML
jgi:hypothetical protein